MSSSPIQRSSSRPPAAPPPDSAELHPTDAARKPGTPPAAQEASKPASAGSAAAPTAYAQAKADPDAAPAASTTQAAPRPRGRREGMSLGKTQAKAPASKADQSGGVSAADEPAKKSPTESLSPTELQAARDRFGKERIYKVVDDLFFQRHPELNGKPIKPAQKELSKEWLDLRAGVEEAGIQKMVADGKSDPKEIAREVFDARHTELKGKKLNATQQKELSGIEKQVNTSLEPLKQLQGSASYKALDAAGQAQATALMRANFADPQARTRVSEAVDSLGSVKSAAGKTQVLEGLVAGSPLSAEKLTSTKALLGSPKFGALTEADQNLVAEGLKGAKADPKYAESTKKLVEDAKFQALGADEKTAILSQVKNYPDARSVDNLQRMVQKDWFNDFSLADKQRASKMVGFLSQHNGDRAIIENTLDKFLAPGATIKLDFNTTGNPYGTAPDGKLSLNPRYIPAGNDKVDTTNSDTMHMTTHTFAHEVNHNLNGDKVAKTAEYFMAEYRGFYVGFKAQNGREPTRDEVLDRVRHLLTSTSGAYNRIRQALADSTEGPKIVDFMKQVLGRDDVTQANAATLASRDGTTNAPVPTSGNLDNH